MLTNGCRATVQQRDGGDRSSPRGLIGAGDAAGRLAEHGRVRGDASRHRGVLNRPP